MSTESDLLHARVRAFIGASLRALDAESADMGTGGGETARMPASRETFEELANAIGELQMRCVGVVGRLWRARGWSGGWEEMPGVPADVFRLARVAAHPVHEDVAVFRTSGTTSGARGEHAFRTLETYAAAALGWGDLWLLGGRRDLAVISLTPPPAEANDSSLVHMIELFARQQSGGVSFHLAGGALDLDGVERASAAARAEGRRVLLCGTSFAFVHALDGAGGRDLRLPEGSRAMLTGGFKGRSREVAAEELRRGIAAAFGIEERAVVGEYGMTELSSQLYERTLLCTHARHGVYTSPPWVRVTAMDPETLAPVRRGEVGIARIVDLANVGSAIAIQTADRVRVLESGDIELLGRLPGATPRGCSLAVEEVLG
ncbi:MAG: acyl-protein synthetase [Polyangiaceae bacterium]